MEHRDLKALCFSVGTCIFFSYSPARLYLLYCDRVVGYLLLFYVTLIEILHLPVKKKKHEAQPQPPWPRSGNEWLLVGDALPPLYI